MAVRGEIRSSLTELSGNDGRALAETFLTAELVLQQSYYYKSARKAMEDDELRRDLPVDYAERRPRQIRKEFERRLPSQYLDLELSDEETGAVVDVLLRRLDDGPEAARGAAGALTNSAQLRAVPKLADLLRRRAQADDMVAWSVVHSMEHILRSVDPRGGLTAEQEQIIADACAALQVAAAGGVGGNFNVREAAARVRADVIA